MFRSSSGNFGENWTSSVYLYAPNDKGRKIRRSYSRQQQNELKRQFTPRDLIKNLTVYERPIEGIRPVRAKHHFITIEYSHGWLSIEKTKTGIHIGISPKQSVTRDSFEGKPRPQPVKEMGTDTGNPRETVRHLIGYLYNNELDKPYHLIRENCQKFAKRIMARFGRNNVEYR